MNEIKFRTAQVGEVSFPERTIELIVTPYEEPIQVKDWLPGKTVTEIVTRGAYDGIQRRPNRVIVNRDHDVKRTCGRAVNFWPDRDEGLIAELRISRTDLGNETLELAADDILKASAGFRLLEEKATGKAKPGAAVWETRDRVRLNHLWLDHVALTPVPAHESARVVAVRRQAADDDAEASVLATPNLDRVLALIRSEEYARLSR
jgi:HK97 family phage prohead protease